MPTRDELIAVLKGEVRILMHLASKAKAEDLDYRPSPEQRSVLELLRYLAIMGPIHARAIKSGTFNMDAWRDTWSKEEARSKAMSFDEAKEAIRAQPELFAQLFGASPETELGEEIELFGSRSSRASWIVKLLVSHYAAYRMQLFLYLKASGHKELNTLNLWVGRDAM